MYNENDKAFRLEFLDAKGVKLSESEIDADSLGSAIYHALSEFNGLLPPGAVDLKVTSLDPPPVSAFASIVDGEWNAWEYDENGKFVIGYNIPDY